MLMNNQTDSLVHDELFFSIGRLASIGSLLFILILILVIIFFLFHQEQITTNSTDEHELRSDLDGTATTENKQLKSNRFQQYASTDSGLCRLAEQDSRSTTNLVASK